MRLRLGCVSLVLTALVMAGCAASPDLTADRAHTLQTSVLAVSQAAAEGRWDDATALLAATRTELDQGADLGEVSPARYREINAALVETQTELDAEKARADAAEQQRAALQAAADQAAEQTAASPEPAPEVAPATPKGKDKHPEKKGKSGK